MQIDTIVYCNMIGFVLLAMLLISSHEFANKNKIENKMLFKMVYIIMGACLAETIGFFIDGMMFPGSRFIYMFLNTYLYVATTLYPVLWIQFVDWKIYGSIEKNREIKKIIAVPLCILWILILLNIRYGFFFQLSKDNYYSRGEFFWIALGAPYVYLVISVIMVVLGRKHNRYLFFPVWLFVAPIFIAGLVQTIFYGISVIWVAIAVGLETVYISQLNEITYVDSLTGIYNRKYMSYILRKHENKKSGCAGIMIDLDHFKSINDEYGHDVGDDAIIETARLLKEAIPMNAIVTRFAGDEFVVLVDTAHIKEVKEIMEKISNSVSGFNEENAKLYTLELSMGYSFYWPENNTTEEFLKEMDQQMYACTNERHLDEWREKGMLI